MMSCLVNKDATANPHGYRVCEQKRQKCNFCGGKSFEPPAFLRHRLNGFSICIQYTTAIRVSQDFTAPWQIIFQSANPYKPGTHS